MGSFKKFLKKSAKITTLAATAGAYDGQGGGWGHDLTNPKGDDSGEKQLAQVMALLREADMRARVATQRSVETQRKILPLLAKSFDTARSRVALSGTPAKQEVLDREEGTLAQVQGHFAGGNMYNSSLRQNAVRAVRGDTDRTLLQIDQAIGQRLAALDQSEAGLKAGVYSAIGDTFERGAATSAAILGNQASAIQSVQHKKKKDIFDLLGSVAPIIGGAAAGLPGLAIGTAAGQAVSGQSPAFNPQMQNDPYDEQTLIA